MAAAYFENGMGEESACFELFVRRLPRDRGYLLSAGLEQAVEYLLGLQFDAPAIEYLRNLPVFGAVSGAFWDYLANFRFTGDLDAMPEGTAAFPHEPLLQVRSTLMEAQMVETFLLATLNHQTLIATKAARVVEAADRRGVIEFGARRAHGFDAAIYGTRAAYIAGCIGTSNVLAGQAFGIPVYGTAAHSFTMAFEKETEAFRAFQRVFPDHAILLIDTYDPIEGARRAASLGVPIRGVRLDSGDLAAQSREIREILNEAGLRDAVIVASGDLNEDSVAELLAAGAPIDLFGVGTELITSRDAPALGGVYKLVAIEQDGRVRGVRKLSQDKSTYPHEKQVYRAIDGSGIFRSDRLALRSEPCPDGHVPLLVPVLRRGELVGPLPSLSQSRQHAESQRHSLPSSIRRRLQPDVYPLTISEGVERAMAEFRAG
jgi:nicotinate phosphoribosyltransferase